MIILGVILLALGFIFGLAILWQIGIVLLVIGLILLVFGHAGHPLGGRKHWY